MAITYESNLVKKKMRHRGQEQGKPYSVSGRIFLADGTVLGSGDLLLGVPVGENMVIESVDLLVLGDTSTAAGSVGYFQILDDAGDPVEVQRNGPFGASDSKFASPATDDDHYHAAMQLDGYTVMDQATPTKLAGPVNVGIKITTGATVAADTEIFIGVRMRGESSMIEVVGTGGPHGDQNDYLL